jgi:hypothetical protein
MNLNESKIRAIAFYLPQFHPIPENDEWWGAGFTEWTNVGKAKKLYRGHEQPKVPSELGYYDLRLAETRIKQAELAQLHGIEGFCYWHYWFGNGKRLLELPFNQVVESKEPNFPFCLAWANDSWQAKLWNSEGVKVNRTLQEQLYLGKIDQEEHFYALLSSFKDARYIRIDEKPIFVIYKPFDIPDIKEFISLWRSLAIDNGLQGLHFVAQTTDIINYDELLKLGFDSVNVVRLYDFFKYGISFYQRVINYINNKIFNKPTVFQYREVSKYFSGEEDSLANVFPSIIPNWDHTPRSGRGGLVYSKSTPDLFRIHLKHLFQRLRKKSRENNVVFIKSWNEWAEGNYMEPDLKYGRRYLEVLKEEIANFDAK